MFKKLVATVLLLVTGYVIGVRAGFKAAVHDYVYNDAELLESQAESLSEEAVEIPEEVREKLEQAEASTARRGFQ